MGFWVCKALNPKSETLNLRCQGLGIRVPVFFFSFQVSGPGMGLRFWGCRLGALGFGVFMVLRAPGYGFRVEGLGFKV